MGVFRFNFDKPGPGVLKNEPRKKGALRFIEVFTGGFGNLIKVNLLFSISVFPSAAVFLAGLFGYFESLALILSLIVALPTGGAVCATMFCITKMLCDDPSFIWHDFKRKYKENVKQAALPGVFSTAFIYAQIYLWNSILFGGFSIGFGAAVLEVISLLVFGMIVPCTFIQIAYIELRLRQIIKNSILISLVNAPRIFMGVLTSSIIWVAFVMFLPVSLLFVPIILLFGFSLSWLLNLMWIWPPINRQFAIEESIYKRCSLY